MSLPIERAQSRKPITWLTIIGAILLPAIIGGILVAALYNPAERLENMTAAIVNDDDPVTIDGQYVPLGRQLTAGLVEGSDDFDSNLTWVISNDEDAASGLSDGTYDAVITIPSNFSAAATSTRPGQTPEQAKIEVVTADDSRVVDGAITAQVSQAAASVLGQTLSQTYLENVLLGFTTLSDQLGQAASGAEQLADGATQAADGTTQLADGIGQLASGAGQLAAGLGTLGDSTRQAADGASQLAAAQTDIANKVGDPALPGAAQQMSGYITQTATGTKSVATSLGYLAATCAASGASGQFCTDLGVAAQSAVDAATAAGTAKGYADNVVPGITALTSQTSAGLGTVAAETGKLAGGLTQLADGTAQSQSGAQALQSGAADAQSGAEQLASGNQQLAQGTRDLASGLDTAVAQLPTYSDQEAKSLAEVVADPVAADGVGTDLFGASAVPLLAAVVLWFGGLISFVVLQAVTRRTLSSRASSLRLAFGGFWPAAVIGALQGLLVAVVAQLAAGYDAGEFSLFLGVSILAGVAFAAVHQALLALFGGAGRWLAAIAGTLAIATGIISTVPGVLSDLAQVLPTAPAYNGLLAAITPAGGVGAAVAGLAIWAAVSFAVTIVATARRRTVRADAVASVG